MKPDIDKNGVPWCTEDCPEHDGKRCRLLGFRPDRICEPYVKDIITKNKELKDQVKILSDSICDAIIELRKKNEHSIG